MNNAVEQSIYYLDSLNLYRAIIYYICEDNQLQKVN